MTQTSRPIPPSALRGRRPQWVLEICIAGELLCKEFGQDETSARKSFYRLGSARARSAGQIDRVYLWHGAEVMATFDASSVAVPRFTASGGQHSASFGSLCEQGGQLARSAKPVPRVSLAALGLSGSQQEQKQGRPAVAWKETN